MNDEWAAWVIQAQTGDGEAFGRLVDRFQDMAYYTAYRSLEDRQQAEDAAQDAFWDAYRYLPSLAAPLAFPAWLQRIVWKHCDRRFRSGRLPLVSLDDERHEITADSLSPDAMLEQLQHEQALHVAIQELADPYRRVVTLFYLQGFSYQETAARLNLPVSTIKKRLHTARQHLKEKIRPMSTTTYHPSQDETFADRVKFSIALKTNDLLQVRQLARRDPALLASRAEWGVGSDGWHWPLGVTPLHWAASVGDRPLAELLAELGADINARDINGNTPLKRAAHMGQAEMVAWLLKQGTDPNVAANNGQTPLHVAVTRSTVARFAKPGEATRVNNPRYDLIETLLAYGADPTVQDSQGRTPGDWAAVKGLTTLAQRLGAEGAAVPATASSAIQPAHGAMWETGIKMIDLLAPLKWGGRNGVFTPLAGIGVDVLLGELIQRMAAYYGGTAVQIGIEQGDFTEANRRLQWRNYGVERHVETFFAREKDSAARRRYIAEQGIKRAREQAAEQPVLFLAYTNLALSDGVMDMINELDQVENITVLFAGIESVGAEPPELEHLDAALTFDRERAQQGLWPAIDGLRSYSTTFHDGAQREMATAARRLFARYRDLGVIYNNHGMTGFDMALFSDADRQAVIRAQRLHRFLAQPLYVAEAWSAVPGEFAPLAETLQTSAAILTGEMDNIPEDKLANSGSWSPKWT